MRLVNVRPDGKKRVGSAPHADTIGLKKKSASRVNSAMTSDASRHGSAINTLEFDSDERRKANLSGFYLYRGASLASAGFDGWTRKAFPILLGQAWQDRVDLEDMAKEQGIFPHAYLHVPVAML